MHKIELTKDECKVILSLITDNYGEFNTKTEKLAENLVLKIDKEINYIKAKDIKDVKTFLSLGYLFFKTMDKLDENEE